MTDRTERQIRHIGIFNDSYPPILDGVTLTVENYVRWLGAMGKNPCVVTPWNPLKVDCGYDVLRYFSLPIFSRRPYRYGYPRLDPFIWRKLNRTPFRLVHSHCPFSSGRLAVYVKKRHRVPLIGTFHSKYRTDLLHSFPRAPWFVDIIMNRIIDFFNSCDEVWIPQASVEPTVREYGYKGPLTVVDNGIDFADIPDSDIARVKKQARTKLGIADSTLTLLFVGQHIWEKGIGIIADTLPRLMPDIDFRIDFIGTGYAAQDLRKIVKRLGVSDRTQFHGTVADRETLKTFYAAADLFLFPSLYDNAPLVVREAAAMGTPAIIPEGSTASEIIRNPQNGFLTGPTSEEYATLIRSLAANRQIIRAAGHRAKQTIVRSWEDVVAEVADRYESLLRRTHNL